MRRLRNKNRIWLALIALLLAAALCACGQTPAPAPSPTPAPAATPEPTPAPTPTPTPTPTPAPTPEPTPAPPASQTDLKPPPASGSDLQPTPEPTPVPRVDGDFFSDAAFLGNSLMEGLRLYGGLPCGDFYSGTSASVISVRTTKDARDSAGAPATMLHALLEKQYGKIFILLGINELGFYQDAFIDIYGELIDSIREGEPDATIYIFSLTPVTEKRDRNDEIFKKERVLSFNAAIAGMAERKGCVYMDLYGALADENGWLPESESGDGVHFSGKLYGQWVEYLMTYPYADAAAP